MRMNARQCAAPASRNVVGPVDHRVHIPEILKLVKIAHARLHDVHDDIRQIDEDPLSEFVPFDTERVDAGIPGPLEHDCPPSIAHADPRCRWQLPCSR